MPGMGQDERIPDAMFCARVNVFLKRIRRHGQRFRRETPFRSFFESWAKIIGDGWKDETSALE
jgi:hypothetical protein